MSLEEKVTMLSGVQAQELNLPNIEKIDPDKPIFSFSRFKTYMSCPAQYDFVYNKKRERSKDIVLSIGSTVHYLAERYSAEVIKGNTPTPEELELIGKEYWKTESQSLVETDLQKLEGFEEAYKLFNVYLPELQKVKPKMVEQHILYYPPGKEWPRPTCQSRRQCCR